MPQKNVDRRDKAWIQSIALLAYSSGLPLPPHTTNRAFPTHRTIPRVGLLPFSSPSACSRKRCRPRLTPWWTQHDLTLNRQLLLEILFVGRQNVVAQPAAASQLITVQGFLWRLGDVAARLWLTVVGITIQVTLAIKTFCSSLPNRPISNKSLLRK